jgi:hypothetical protein
MKVFSKSVGLTIFADFFTKISTSFRKYLRNDDVKNLKIVSCPP